jgi:hypothetical protein
VVLTFSHRKSGTSTTMITETSSIKTKRFMHKKCETTTKQIEKTLFKTNSKSLKLNPLNMPQTKKNLKIKSKRTAF